MRNITLWSGEWRKRTVKSAAQVDAPGGTRTRDLRGSNPTLYPLSYRGVLLRAEEAYSAVT